MISRNSNLRKTVFQIFLFLGIACSVSAAPKPNVLFIAIDDQNDWIGAFGGHPLAKTPHIDRLAKRGTAFLNAHCQAPLCNPSRTSLMLGLRPTTTGIYGLAPWFRESARVEKSRYVSATLQTRRLPDLHQRQSFSRVRTRRASLTNSTYGDQPEALA